MTAERALLVDGTTSASAAPAALTSYEDSYDVEPAGSLSAALDLTPVMAPPSQRPVAVYLARLAPGARRSQLWALRTMAEILAGAPVDATTLPWHLLGYQHTQALRSTLAVRYAPATANRMLAALRAVLLESWRLGLMSAEARARAGDLAPVRGTTLPRGRALKGGELRALFAVCIDEPAGMRDAALLATLYAAGLRRSEAVALDVADYDPTYSDDAAALTVRHGKGDKARVVYLQNGARAAMAAWIAVRGVAPGPLFIRIRKGGVFVYARLSDQAALCILQARCRQAGVTTCSPHDLRRSMISDLLDAGADISTVQRLAGHANVTTTQRYDRRGEAVKAKAAGLLHTPYAGLGYGG